MTRSKIIILVVVCCLAAGALYFFRFSPEARKSRHLSRGDRYFEAGEYEKAKLEYFNVARADSSNKHAVERLGLIWMDQGAPAQAMPFLGRARELSPNDVEIRLRIARALTALGDFRSGWKEGLAALQQSPESAEAWIAAADTAASKEEVEILREKLKAVQTMTAAQHYAAAVVALKDASLAATEQQAAAAQKQPAEAQTHFAEVQKHLTAAETHLQQCLEKDPSIARAHLRLGDLALGRRDLAKAGESIKQAYSIAPARSSEKLRYPEFLLQTGKLAEAREALAPVLAEAPDYLPASILAARISAADKKPEEGLATLGNVFSRDSASAEARLLQAQLQMAKGDLPAAVENLERLTKAYPKGILPKMELGRAYALSQRPAEAADVLRQALALNPDFPEAQLLLAELDLRAAQPQRVVDSLQRLVTRNPNLPRAQLLLADAYRMLKQYDEAAAIYRKQAEGAPQNVLPLLFLGTVQREQQKPEEARATFEKAAQLEPNNLVILNHLVELDLGRKDYASAQARLAKLDEKTRATAGARVLEARIFGAQKLWQQAEESLLQAIQTDPDSGPAYQLLVALYYENGRIPEAIQRLEEKLARTPDDAASGMLLARLQEEQKNHPAARAAYEAVLAKRPDSMVALNNLAYLLAVQFNDAARAVELGRKARAIDPNNPAVADTLGWILYGTGEYEAALGLLQESAAKLAERGNVPGEVHYHLGMANSSMGNFESARIALTKAADEAADFPGKATIPIRLQLLHGSAATAPLGVERLEALAKEQPGDPLIQLRLGEALEAQGKAPAAAVAYEGALKANPKFALAAARLARLYSRDLSDPPKARDYAKTARSLAPSDRHVAEVLGTTAARLGDVPWSYSLLQQAVTPSSAGPDAIFEFAIVAYRLGKTKEARQALDRATAASPSAELAARIQRYREILDLTEDPAAAAQAESRIAEAEKSEETRLPAAMARAQALVEKGDFNGAAGIYEALLASEPAFPIAKIRLAAVKLRLGDWERAHELATAARALIPEDPLTAWVLGQTSYRKREFSRAVDFLKEAQRAKPLDAERLFYLGAAYFELKNRAEAERVLGEAVAAGLPPEQLRQAEEMLKQLGK